jgi:hypothetical protein
MTKIIIQIERTEDAQLLEAFAKNLGLAYSYEKEALPNDSTALSDEDWIKSMSGSWNDFPETAEEMIATIEHNKTLERSIEIL